MESKSLSVYTDASDDIEKGAIAFSAWDDQNCLGHFSSILNNLTEKSAMSLASQMNRQTNHP